VRHAPRRRRAVAPLPRAPRPQPGRKLDDLSARDVAYVRALVAVVAAQYDDPDAHRVLARLSGARKPGRRANTTTED
jgi:hypothetical protein